MQLLAENSSREASATALGLALLCLRMFGWADRRLHRTAEQHVSLSLEIVKLAALAVLSAGLSTDSDGIELFEL